MSTPNRYDLVGELEMVEVEGGRIFCIVLDEPLDQFMCQHYAISFPTAENRLSMLGVVPASWEGKRVKITVEEEAEKLDLDVKIIKLDVQSRLMNGDFGAALYVLKRGGKVTRRGWNGNRVMHYSDGGVSLDVEHPEGTFEPRMYLFLCHLSFAGMSQLGVPPGVWPEISDLLKRDTDSDKPHAAPDIARPFIAMKDAEDKIVVGWLASQTDMLAEDWVEVP